MRKTNISGLVLALTLVSATAATAQQGQVRRPERAQGQQMDRQGGRALGGLLRGIELTADQETKLKAIVKEHRPEGRGEGVAQGQRQRQGRGQGAAGRGGQGQRPDSTGARRPQGDFRALVEQRAELIKEVRAILTSEQRTQLDRNIEEMKKRAEQGRTERQGKSDARLRR